MVLLKKLYCKPFSLVILDEEETLFQLSKQRDFDGIALEIQRRNTEKPDSQVFISIALLGYMMNGSILAIRIANIGTLSEQNFVTVEMRSSAILRQEQVEIVLELADPILELMS
jgi:hypothetical protein